MNPDEIKDMLADYLGGELEPDRKRRFEEYLTTDPSFAEEVKSLRDTLEAMRSLDEPTAVSVAGKPDGNGRTGLGRTLAVMRYAAVILMAFTVGYLVRDLSGGPGEAATPRVVQGVTQEDPAEWQIRLATAYSRYPGKSSLARSLVALAQATR